MTPSSAVQIGSTAPAAGPLQIDTTIALAAVIVFALATFVAVMVYLAFGPHNTILQDDETPINGSGSAAEESRTGTDSEAEAVQGQPDEPNAGDGAETDASST